MNTNDPRVLRIIEREARPAVDVGERPVKRRRYRNPLLHLQDELKVALAASKLRPGKGGSKAADIEAAFSSREERALREELAQAWGD